MNELLDVMKEKGVGNLNVKEKTALFPDRNLMRVKKLDLQICFRTEKALSLLHFEGSERL